MMHIFPYEQFMYDNYGAYRLSKLVKCVLPPVLLTVGTAGNLLGMAVLLRHSKSVPLYLYLILIAVADQMVLSTGLLWKWLKEAFGFRIETLSSLSCKLTFYVQFSFSYASVWLIVAMTIERFYAVVSPLRASTNAHSRRRIRWTAALIYAADLLLFNSHWMYTMDLLPKARNLTEFNADLNASLTSEFTYHDCDLRPALGIAYFIYWLDTVCYLLIPFTVIFLLNLAIIVHLVRPKCSSTGLGNQERRRQRRHRQHPSLEGSFVSTSSCGSRRGRQNQHQQHQNQQAERLRTLTASPARSRSARQVTIMLVTICACYLLCTLPIALLRVKLSIFLFDLTRSNDLGSIANFYLIEALAEMVMYLSNVGNFYLYVASAGRFRRELKQTFGCLPRGQLETKQRSRYSSQSKRLPSQQQQQQRQHVEIPLLIPPGAPGDTVVGARSQIHRREVPGAEGCRRAAATEAALKSVEAAQFYIVENSHP